MFLNFFWFLGGAQDAEEIPEADGRGRETRTIDGGRGAAVVFDPPPRPILHLGPGAECIFGVGLRGR